MKRAPVFFVSFLIGQPSTCAQTLKVGTNRQSRGASAVPRTGRTGPSRRMASPSWWSWVEPAQGCRSFRPALFLRGPAPPGSEPFRTIAARTGSSSIIRPKRPGMVALKDGVLRSPTGFEQGNESSEARVRLANVSSSRDGVKMVRSRAWRRTIRAVRSTASASIVASGDREASLIWPAPGSEGGDDGPASLMRSVIGADGSELKEETLDADVWRLLPPHPSSKPAAACWSPTAATKNNIRDIRRHPLRKRPLDFSQDLASTPDKWKLDACPINAASASAKAR